MVEWANEWRPIARSSDAPKRHIFHGQLRGVELALWRADNGRLNVWENRCPHRSVRFTIGVNTGSTLRCQYHGWQYRDGDARCVTIPAASSAPPPAGIRARRFAAEEVDGLVWVNLSGASALAPLSPAFPSLKVALQSLTVDAGLDDVRAGLALYSEGDETAVAGSSVVSRCGEDIDLTWKAPLGEHHVRFILQPAMETKTVVHGSASGSAMDPPGLRRLHSRLLARMRRRLETRR